MNVTAKTKLEDGSEGSASVEFEFGDTLEASVSIFGEQRVHDHFVRNAKIALQGYIARLLKAGKSQAEITKSVAEEFKLDGRKPGKSKVDKAADLFAGMSEEEKAAFKKLLKGG